MLSTHRLRACGRAAPVVALALGVGQSTHAQQPSPARYVDEGREWNAVAEQPRVLLRQEAWDRLEQLAEEYRNPRSRFRSGLWKLDAFYRGFRPDDTEGVVPKNWPGFFARLEAWRAARPRSVTVLTALGSAYINYAWEARGDKYANTVESAGWRLYAERLHKAEDCLTTAERLGSRDPETYTLLLRLALSEGWDRPRRQRVLKKAIDLAPGYQATYSEEVTELLPRWGGELGDIDHFAQYAVTRCQDEGEGIYARIVWEVTGYFGESFKEHQFSWPRAQRGFEILRRMYPDSRRVRDGYCWVACHAGDRETAKRLFDEIGDTWTENVWFREVNYLRWRRWARTPP